MANVFLIADTHIGHVGVTKFLRSDGVTKLRPWDNVDEMDEAIVKNWNSVVNPSDKVYHLGDVIINRKAFPTLYRLNGDKVLIKGNHDIFKIEEYLRYFRDVRSCHPLAGMLLSHIPIHESSLSRWSCNVHGHTHSNVVEDKWGKPDPRYKCVSVEHINYTPVSLEEVRGW